MTLKKLGSYLRRAQTFALNASPQPARHFYRVDLTGLEPAISAMRMQRITNCATGPFVDSGRRGVNATLYRLTPSPDCMCA